ncbi:pilus assembly protein PilP [Ideonella alba]|uniref:Pilus assembly protein PilP n=1 Tax=Ideonella alba TaxID=2824118 RepID=A0A940YJY9_9BURK|nr:pilus assembly protein PilP [Ideonella alba]MBQ0931244.1 pilus assembly protein PilP [Ideonella alba]
MSPRWTALPLGIGLLALLSACSDSNNELSAWMDQQRKEIRPRVEPITPPTKFVPQPYLSAKALEPFNPRKMAATSQITRQPNAVLASEMRRRKEPLEAFPLDSMAMVGSVTRGGKPFALIRVDNLLHYVKAGEYMGQNFGRITRITEKDVTLREIVQDAAGEWIERTSTLQLQEKAQ